MDEEITPAESATHESDDARAEAEQAANAKAEELRASVQSKIEQGKSGLGFLAVDSEEEA